MSIFNLDADPILASSFKVLNDNTVQKIAATSTRCTLPLSTPIQINTGVHIFAFNFASVRYKDYYGDCVGVIAPDAKFEGRPGYQNFLGKSGYGMSSNGVRWTKDKRDKRAMLFNERAAIELGVDSNRGAMSIRVFGSKVWLPLFPSGIPFPCYAALSMENRDARVTVVKLQGSDAPVKQYQGKPPKFDVSSISRSATLRRYFKSKPNSQWIYKQDTVGPHVVGNGLGALPVTTFMDSGTGVHTITYTFRGSSLDQGWHAFVGVVRVHEKYKGKEWYATHVGNCGFGCNNKGDKWTRSKREPNEGVQFDRTDTVRMVIDTNKRSMTVNGKMLYSSEIPFPCRAAVSMGSSGAGVKISIEDPEEGKGGEGGDTDAAPADAKVTSATSAKPRRRGLFSRFKAANVSSATSAMAKASISSFDTVPCAIKKDFLRRGDFTFRAPNHAVKARDVRRVLSFLPLMTSGIHEFIATFPGCPDPTNALAYVGVIDAKKGNWSTHLGEGGCGALSQSGNKMRAKYGERYSRVGGFTPGKHQVRCQIDMTKRELYFWIEDVGGGNSKYLGRAYRKLPSFDGVYFAMSAKLYKTEMKAVKMAKPTPLN